MSIVFASGKKVKSVEMTAPRVHILLPVHNRREVTRKIVECLKRQTYREFRLVLVDDGSTDGTAEMVRAEIPETVVLRGNGNWWWGGSLQAGIDLLASRGLPAEDLLLILNDDTEFAPDFIEVGVRLVLASPKSLLQATCRSKQTGGLLDVGTHADWRRFRFGSAPAPKLINCLSTRGLIVRFREVLEIGGFRPSLLPHYGSDYEFTIRARRRGWRLFTDPAFVLSVDERTTGSHGVSGKTFALRAKNLFSKRSAVNPVYLVIFVLLACPWRFKVQNVLRILRGAMKALVAPPPRTDSDPGSDPSKEVKR
jgi:GT2 family glycosyltransferase